MKLSLINFALLSSGMSWIFSLSRHPLSGANPRLAGPHTQRHVKHLITGHQQGLKVTLIPVILLRGNPLR